MISPQLFVKIEWEAPVIERILTHPCLAPDEAQFELGVADFAGGGATAGATGGAGRAAVCATLSNQAR
jgi:hypothetical protein